MKLNLRRTALLGMLGVLLGGCSATRINFDGPPGAVMIVDHKAYHLPAQVELLRPGAAGQSSEYDVSLAFMSVENKEVRAKGHIKIFGYVESDADRVAVNTYKLEEPELVKVLNGVVLIFKGQTTSRQPLFDMTLGKE